MMLYEGQIECAPFPPGTGGYPQGSQLPPAMRGTEIYDQGNSMSTNPTVDPSKLTRPGSPNAKRIRTDEGEYDPIPSNIPTSYLNEDDSDDQLDDVVKLYNNDMEDASSRSHTGFSKSLVPVESSSIRQTQSASR